MFDPAGEKAFIEECREMLGRKTVISDYPPAGEFGVGGQDLEVGAGVSAGGGVGLPTGGLLIDKQRPLLTLYRDRQECNLASRK